eukprot:CAMPEP_0114669310 /NCGR_PEP_ID=MMETSP0191-20121206/37883_1 /TAXON_ID=126664 /ORGANISM="Sorites sp." /LENGTH=77 /DNA_ID=CAMNT_0001924731 /DNA_START=160 /DNA_END=393 /DNA_ORIENTATION=+
MAGFWVRRMVQTPSDLQASSHAWAALQHKVTEKAPQTTQSPGMRRTDSDSAILDAEPLSRAGSISSDEEFLARARRA